MTGSSGCIDVGNSAFTGLIPALAGYRDRIVVTVRYTMPAPAVGPLERAAGRFMYPTTGGENPTLMDRLRSVLTE